MLNFLRIVCLITTLLGGVVWVIWTHSPEYVQSIDDELVESYESEHEELLEVAAEMLKTDREQGLVLLQELAEKLEHVRKRDRLDTLKRRTLALLVLQYETTDQTDLALNWADRFAEFDDRDLHNEARRLPLMLRVPERRPEAELALPRLYRLIPELPSVRSAYIALALEKGEYRAAFRAALESRRTMPLEWRVYWEVDGGFSNKGWAPVVMAPTGAEQYSGSFRLPGSKQVRIYLPPEYEMRIDSWDLTFRTRAGQATFGGPELASKFHQLREEGGVIHADIQISPFILFDVPEDYWAVDLMQVDMRFEIQPLMSSHLEPFKRDERVLGEIRSWLESEGRQAELDSIEAWAGD